MQWDVWFAHVQTSSYIDDISILLIISSTVKGPNLKAHWIPTFSKLNVDEWGSAGIAASKKETYALYDPQSLLDFTLLRPVNFKLITLVCWIYCGWYVCHMSFKCRINTDFLTKLVNNPYVKSFWVWYCAGDPAWLIFAHFNDMIVVWADFTPDLCIVATTRSCIYKQKLIPDQYINCNHIVWYKTWYSSNIL